MSSLTKDAISQLEAALSYAGGSAQLMIDGYKLSLQVVNAGGLKYEIAWYANGHFKGIWLTQDCEERKRFARPITKQLFSAKDKAALTRGLTGKFKKEYLKRWDKTITLYVWSWPSFKPLMRHLIANNQSIELLP